MASFPYFNGTGSAYVRISKSTEARAHISLFRRFTDTQDADPVPLKYGKLATRYPWMYGRFYSVRQRRERGEMDGQTDADGWGHIGRRCVWFEICRSNTMHHIAVSSSRKRRSPHVAGITRPNHEWRNRRRGIARRRHCLLPNSITS